MDDVTICRLEYNQAQDILEKILPQKKPMMLKRQPRYLDGSNMEQPCTHKRRHQNLGEIAHFYNVKINIVAAYPQ